MRRIAGVPQRVVPPPDQFSRFDVRRVLVPERRGRHPEDEGFQGYVRGNGLLMGRHLPASDDAPRPSVNRTTEMNRKAIEHGVADTWHDAKQALDYSARTYYTKSGITFLQRTITVPEDVRVRGSHSLTIDRPGKIRITSYPAAVGLCREEFEKLKEAIPFEAEKPPNAPPTSGAPKQWFCRLDGASWKTGRARLIDFVRAVEGAWREHSHDKPAH